MSAGRLWRKALAVGSGRVRRGTGRVRLAEYVLSIDLGVHGWFFKVPTERLGLAPVGKMALFTALTFEAASLAALLIAVVARDSGAATGRDFWASRSRLRAWSSASVTCMRPPCFTAGRRFRWRSTRPSLSVSSAWA